MSQLSQLNLLRGFQQAAGGVVPPGTTFVSLHTASHQPGAAYGDPAPAPPVWTHGGRAETIHYAVFAVRPAPGDAPDPAGTAETVVERINRLLAAEDRADEEDPGRDTDDSAEYHRGPRKPAAGWECQVCYTETRWPYEPARSVPSDVTDEETLCVAHGGPQPDPSPGMAAGLKLRELRATITDTDELRAAQQQVMSELNATIARRVEAICAEFTFTAITEA